ncbi:DUF1772 domain-containing protein [uncultured Cocleimonas sp.]|uniref:DUF1772 domain-containing protein n=1 Tax=uncultured Cocleimonas sp. TaxID=1051587 RepID=UPI002610BE35|nr:DUF1772 domain-containing protein [uncultured Cocleimonas sp.]
MDMTTMKSNHGFTLMENTSLAIATIAFGIMAGFFWTYSFNVNYAMQQVDGATYAQVQSLFNQNVRHSMFFIFFFGGGAFSVIAILFNLKQRRSVSFWMLVLASVIYIVGVIIYTKQVNLPLNYYTESWNITNLPNDWEATRDSWNSANLLRVVTSFIAFLMCVAAFVVRSSRL